MNKHILQVVLAVAVTMVSVMVMGDWAGVGVHAEEGMMVALEEKLSVLLAND